jgi:hypothetical protein
MGNNMFVKKLIVHGFTSHNGIVYASPPYAGSGYEKPQSGLRLLCGFSPPHFADPGRASCGSDASQRPYPGGQNLAIPHSGILSNNRNVKN